MTTLTQEHFDTELGGLRQEVAAMKTEIKEEIQELARITANGFADLEKRLDVRERVDTLETKFKKLESALNLQL
jgi:hypothetical protein